MLTQIIDQISQQICTELSLSADKAAKLFEIPKDLSHGHFSIPVFFLAKERKKAPAIIAQDIVKEISEKLLTKKNHIIERVDSVGGYINFHLNDAELFLLLYNEVILKKHRFGFSDLNKNKTVVIDYSSPNVAKPMHVGHLRATVIGQAIRNLAESQGYKVIGLNHLGDWGAQFGKLAYAYKKWGSEYPFATEPFESLFKLYVRFHDESDKNPEIEKEGSATFKHLEDGDPELLKLWKMFVEISMTDFERQWKRLGVKHDLVRGESFYNDKLKTAEKLIEDKGLLVESEGAMVVDLTDEKMPPCLIRKGDGASLYATRDVASALYRMEELKADINLYVVGVEQTLHFKQVFSVLRRMGYSWWNKCHHISFGMYRFKDVGKMSSRKGQIIRLEDLLSQAISEVKKFMLAKNPDSYVVEGKSANEGVSGDHDLDVISEQVALGAIIFNDLVNDRVRDVDFDWKKALSFEGDSGPYLQYVHVRCTSILNKYFNSNKNELLPSISSFVALDSPSERELIKVLMRYEEVLTNSFENFRPNILAGYLLDVSGAFNKFYHDHRIIGGEEKFLTSRIALVYCTREVIKNGLAILNIQAPLAM
ncbi:MAG: arginine--tRNA ligase [Bdellovibrionales bacterium]